MVAQTRVLLNKYREKGGHYSEMVFTGCAHASLLEKPEAFVAALRDFAGHKVGAEV